MTDPLAGFTEKELRKLRSMKDPHGIQKFLDDAPYHLADTAWSPRRVLAEQTAHCLEGAWRGARYSTRPNKPASNKRRSNRLKFRTCSGVTTGRCGIVTKYSGTAQTSCSAVIQ